MKLGIDFGTNRTIVAAADRGNFPLVSFDAPDGSTADWIPSLVAVSKSGERFGWDAWSLQANDEWTIIRSIKRLLEDAGPHTIVQAGDSQWKVLDLLNGFARYVFERLRESSNLQIAKDEPLEAVLGVPAHANSNQRFLTAEAFRNAGFQVLGMLNEPSAASIEFGHRQRQTKAAPQTILVYDLGGGTFDTSLVTIDEDVHHVIGSEGIGAIGGDDFDEILANMALDAAEIEEAERDRLPAGVWFRLLEECRVKKEALNPNSRRVVIDLDHIDPAWNTVHLPVADFYELARPLMEQTIAAAEDLAARHSQGQFEALYITGGGSELPLVARVLRERFGRRVRRSAYARSATAIGLAIQAESPDTYRLSDQLARFFGVWREAQAGDQLVFDPVFTRGQQLPAPGEGPHEVVRSYHPVHNLGHFRFLECSHRGADGKPTGEIALWDQIFFPFDPALAESEDLSRVPVTRSNDASGQYIQERYRCDSTGSISVEIENLTTGYQRRYRLGRWSNESASQAAAAPHVAAARRSGA